MKKSVVIGAFVGIFVLLIVPAWLLNSYQRQIASLQAQVFNLQLQSSELIKQLVELHNQTDSLENQNRMLQNQTDSLESQNNLLVNQLGNLTEQLALQRPIKVDIMSLWHAESWSSFGGLNVAYPFNVTIRNNDIVTVSGLILTVRTYSGNQSVGYGYPLEIDLLGVREERIISSVAVVSLTEPRISTYVATLKSGDVVLDEFTYP